MMNDVIAKVIAATTYEEDLTSFSYTRTNTYDGELSTTYQTKTAYFYSNYTEYENARYASYGNEIEKVFRTAENGRYYEVTTDVTDPEAETITGITGYEIVDEVLNPYSEMTQDEVDAELGFASGTTDGFALATSLEALWECAFENYDAEYSYNLSATKTYSSAGVTDYVYSSISYISEIPSSWGGAPSVYCYTIDLGYDANGKVNYALFTQDSYDSYSENYDFDAHMPIDAPSSSYFTEYTFEFGELTEGVAPYTMSDIIFSDYTVKTYTDYAHTNETTTFSVGEYIYFAFEGTPETACYEKPILESIEGDKITWSSAGSSVNYISTSSAGSATLTFVSAAGIRRSIDVTVKAPTPTSISFNGNMPSVLAVNGTEALPYCSTQPYQASNKHNWTIVEGADFAEITYDADSDTHYIKGLAAGIVKVQAYALDDETIVTPVYEIEVTEPKSEAELNTILTTTNWAVNDGAIYNLSFNTDGTGVIDFGFERTYDWEVGYIDATEKTLYTFNWELDYANGAFIITEGTWAYRMENGNFADFGHPTITPSLLGDKVNVYFGSYYNWDFVAAYSSEELHSAITGSKFYGYFSSFHYADFYFRVNETTISFFAESYVGGETVETDVASVEYTWDANNNIVLTGGDFAYSFNVYGTYYDIVISSTLTVETSFGSYINVSFTADGTTYTAKCNKTNY